MQRAWMDKGVKNARRKATDNDKIGRKFRTEASEKQAAKARQTERMIERLDVVEEPRKEWELRMEIAAAPRSGAVVATAARRGGAPRRLHPRPGRPADRLGRPGRDHRRQRRRQVDAARRAARPGPARRGPRRARLGRRGRRGRPGPRAVPRRRAAARRVRRGRPRRPNRPTSARCWRSSACKARPRAAPGGDPVAGRADPGRAGAAAGAAASTCWCWTSRPTTSTCPRSSSWSRRWTRTPGTLLLVTHDRRMLDAVHTTRRFHEVADGSTSSEPSPWSRFRPRSPAGPPGG